MSISSLSLFSTSDTDFEYEQIKAKLEEFENTDTEIEDFEDEGYLTDLKTPSALLIDENSELKELGCVYSIVDGILIVQSTFSSVLESGTIATLPNRTPIGIIGDTFGPVECPFYSIKITEASLIPTLVPELPILFCPNSSKSFDIKDLESSESESEEEP